ncbi:sigma-70 family RNA polymerase sigma factor [Spirosoma flavus]
MELSERRDTTVNEDELWKTFKEGSEAAFEEIYTRYFKVLYNYASKFTTDKNLVQDCIHDLFIEIWEKRENLSDTTSIKYYLFKAMRYTMIDQLKRKPWLVENGTVSGGFDFVLPYEAHLIAEQLSDEQNARILKALNTLTQRQKEAIFLKFYNNLSYEEIASIMSMNIDSSYNLISKALRVLRKNITPISLVLLLCDFSSYSMSFLFIFSQTNLFICLNNPVF